MCLHFHRESKFGQSRTFTVNPNCRNNFFQLFTWSYANSNLWPPVPKYFSINSLTEHDIHSTKLKTIRRTNLAKCSSDSQHFSSIHFQSFYSLVFLREDFTIIMRDKCVLVHHKQNKS